MKIKGYYDPDKIDKWTEVMEKTIKRRVARNREKTADKNFFSQPRRVFPLSTKGSEKLRFSRESLAMFEAVDLTQEIAEKVEWQFANQFQDFKDMSTMVGLTGGASCSDIGITNYECKGQLAESV